MWVVRLWGKISENAQYQSLYKATCFLLNLRDWKKILARFFFQSLANDDVKVNKTKNLYLKYIQG